MHDHTPAELRAQAAHARQLASDMYNRDAQAELRKIADALDDQAEELESRIAADPRPLTGGT